MSEVWLHPNRRALYAGMVLPALVAAAGLAAALVAEAIWLRGIGLALAALGALLVGLLAWQSRQPRIAYEPGYLRVYLRLGSPLRVPLGIVECCFLGSGPLKLSDTSESSLKTANLVFRLADRATDWVNRPVKPALGKWADGYITIHGAWCEPLTLEVMKRINSRLHEVHEASASASCENRPAEAQAEGHP